ncbi:hypothetical protein SUGI_0930370 [Cryptomeria japonica]|nr:hypothetical protein SUGI_0930370 [Cryptomeria japonica]
MDLQNIALGAKLSWKMYREPQKLWCKIFQKKYLDMDQPNRILTVANADRGSATWNFLWECRSVITDHISWHIGRGNKAKFWEDSWEGEPALNELFMEQDWINSIKDRYGSYVEDYFDPDHSNSNIRKWKQVDFGCPDLYDQLRSILSRRNIPVSNADDNIFWCGSKPGWLELNFDGACRGNPGASGFGVVIRNSEGKLLLGSYGGFGVATNNEAEIWALLESLNLCVTNKMTKIVIEGDSLVIIQGIIKRGFESKNLNKWVPCISRLLNDINHYEFTHTYREGNRVTDFVANLGVDISLGTTTFDIQLVSEPVRDLIKADYAQ